MDVRVCGVICEDVNHIRCDHMIQTARSTSASNSEDVFQGAKPPGCESAGRDHKALLFYPVDVFEGNSSRSPPSDSSFSAEQIFSPSAANRSSETSFSSHFISILFEQCWLRLAPKSQQLRLRFLLERKGKYEASLFRSSPEFQ